MEANDWQLLFVSDYFSTGSKSCRWIKQDNPDDGTTWEWIETKHRTSKGVLRPPQQRVVLTVSANGRGGWPKLTAADRDTILAYMNDAYAPTPPAGPDRTRAAEQGP